MATPDYDQFAEDHQCLLILIKSIGPQMNSSLFSSIYDRLSQLYEFKITNTRGYERERIIRLRYKQSYSIENNDWGDFQAHRRLVGLITIGRSFNDNEIESISELHNTIRDTYANTLFDSRCFIIRSNGSSQPSSMQSSTINADVSQNEIEHEGTISVIINGECQTSENDKNNDDENDQTSTSTEVIRDGTDDVIAETSSLFDNLLLDDGCGGGFMNVATNSTFTSRVNRLHSSSSSSSSSLSSRLPSTSDSPMHQCTFANSEQANSTISSSSPSHQQTSATAQQSTLSSPLSSSPPPSCNGEVSNTEKSKDPLSTNFSSNINPHRIRTHSRNKSLDSRLLLSHTKNNSSIDTISGSDVTTDVHASTRPSNLTGIHSSSSSSLLETGITSDSGGHYHHHYQATLTTTNEYVRYESDEQCCRAIEARVREFLTSIFWVLESKRLDRASEKMDKVPLLMAPFEKKDLIGLNTDTRLFRRKCLGRMSKHIADLSLLAGLPQESFHHYNAAIDQLKAANDKLWLASAYEGLCAASQVLAHPFRWEAIHRMRRRLRMEKNIYNDIVSRCDYDVARTEIGDAIHGIAIAEQQRGEHTPGRHSATRLTVDQYYERYKEAASFYASYGGAAILEFECSFKAARTLMFYQRNLRAADFIQNAVFIAINQTVDEQIERLLQISALYENISYYRKAAFYKRFAALKSVSLSHKTPNWERCYYLLLSAVHGYGLTLDPAEYDHRLALNRTHWPNIHVQLLQEMITTSCKMGNEMLAMRHLSFMLQCLYVHITPTQRKEFTTRLTALASRVGEGSPVILKLANSASVPSVNLTKFPTVIYFKVEPLSPYLRPVKLRLRRSAEAAANAANSWGPFIYTPLQMNRSPMHNITRIGGGVGSNSSSRDTQIIKCDFYWCEGNHGRVTVTLHNYLPVEMHISSIMLMTDGVVAVETKHDYPVTIPAYSTTNDLSLVGIPRSSGTLEILGYKVHTLGIRSDCRLATLPNAQKLKLPGRYHVEVVPRLPLMCAECLAAPALTDEICVNKALRTPVENFGADVHISTGTYLSLFTGQRKRYNIRLTNISHQLDELIDLVECEVVFAKNTPATLKQLLNIHWNVETINGTLPIAPSTAQAATFELTIEVAGDFVFHRSNSTVSNSRTGNNNAISQFISTAVEMDAVTKGKVLLPSGKLLGSTKLASLINDFQTKTFSTSSDQKSGPSSIMELATGPSSGGEFVGGGIWGELPKELFEPKIIEFCLQFDYSGGPGLNSGFCRQTAIHFVAEVTPSVLITHWDVLTAAQHDECYMVFDVFNATDHELNLHYAPHKDMLIESKEKCRIPVPIKRCPYVLHSSNRSTVDLSQQRDSITLDNTMVEDSESTDVEANDDNENEILGEEDEDEETITSTLTPIELPVPYQFELTLDDDLSNSNDDVIQDEPLKRYSDCSQTKETIIKSSLMQKNKNQKNMTEKERKEGVDFLAYIYPTNQELDNILAKCKHHLLEQIKLSWSLVGNRPISGERNVTDDGHGDGGNDAYDGVVAIDAVPYSNQMLKALLIPPIFSELCLNNTPIYGSMGEIELELGQSLQIRLRLRNTSASALYDLHLYLHCALEGSTALQSSSSLVGDNTVDATLITTLGANSIFIDMLPTSDSYVHECGFQFLYTGTYKLDIYCWPESRFELDNITNTTTTNTRHNNEQGDEQKHRHRDGNNEEYDNDDDDDDDDTANEGSITTMGDADIVAHLFQQQQQDYYYQQHPSQQPHQNYRHQTSLFTHLHTVEISCVPGGTNDTVVSTTA